MDFPLHFWGAGGGGGGVEGIKIMLLYLVHRKVDYEYNLSSFKPSYNTAVLSALKTAVLLTIVLVNQIYS